MKSNRLEAFSDGVLAILITIMVLEMKVPKGNDLHDLQEVYPVFISYILSFLYLGIYWNNHHHLFQATKYVKGKVLWANLHLLFWLSLIPFTSGWLGETKFAPIPDALYGVVLLMSAIAYFILQNMILKIHGEDSVLHKAIGKDYKGKVSLVLYAAAIPLSFISPWVSISIYFGVALLWIVPDKRIEKTLYKEIKKQQKQDNDKDIEHLN
ncbi:TMEM175 family protein [Bernardetia sp.]|uniref:TMEM175 family protein n=1 Tax=Bernardetia sp. TaxID=1937974 RepID=UPI0025C5896C|nr:TMEM175 family protein [Bernardetia sp.]